MEKLNKRTALLGEKAAPHSPNQPNQRLLLTSSLHSEKKTTKKKKLRIFPNPRLESSWILMPATEEEPIFGWNSRGGRNLRRRKLLVGEKVEVNPHTAPLGQRCVLRV